MPFVPRTIKNKVEMKNKSLYIPAELVERLDRIAKAYDTSFNNIVVSMIEYCIEESHPQEVDHP